MAKTRKRHAKAVSPRMDREAAAKADKRTLEARLRNEKAIIRLAEELERRIRRSDQRLLGLGTALMARGAVLAHAEAQRDVEREIARAQEPALVED